MSSIVTPRIAPSLEPGNAGLPEGQFRAGLNQVDSAGDLQFEELFTQLRERLVTAELESPAYVTERVLRICSRSAVLEPSRPKSCIPEGRVV